MITLTMSAPQAEAVIRDLHRACVLLDACSQRCDNPLDRHACLVQSNRLVDLAEEFDNACRGLATPIVRAGR